LWAKNGQESDNNDKCQEKHQQDFHALSPAVVIEHVPSPPQHEYSTGADRKQDSRSVAADLWQIEDGRRDSDLGAGRLDGSPCFVIDRDTRLRALGAGDLLRLAG
jgi:hypothetical protein